MGLLYTCFSNQTLRLGRDLLAANKKGDGDPSPFFSLRLSTVTASVDAGDAKRRN